MFELWKGRYVARLKAVTCHAHSKVGCSKCAAVGGRVESPISTADRPNADVFSNNRCGPPGGRTLPLSCSESATPDSSFGAGRSSNFEDSSSSQAGMPVSRLQE